MKERFSDYADNYIEYRDFIYFMFKKRPPMDGEEAQFEGLYFLDENELTERERLIMMLSVIKWEVEHNMLTEELKNELDYYYDEVTSGRLEKHITKDDYKLILHDLTECYQRVFCI